MFGRTVTLLGTRGFSQLVPLVSLALTKQMLVSFASTGVKMKRSGMNWTVNAGCLPCRWVIPARINLEF